MKLHIQILIVFILEAFSITISTAQNGQHDVRFIVQNFSCDSSNVTIAVQVRAHDMAHTFNMGDANYRFEYDPRLISSPRIVSQEHFSNVAPSSDSNYGTQNLNGSSVGTSRGLVFLNTYYTGLLASARRVDTAWTTVTLMGFTVVNPSECFALTWHTEQIFPSTNMNEVELLTNGEYNLYVVSGVTFTNVQACFQTNCNSGTSPTVTATAIVTKQDSTASVCMPITDPDANSTFTATVCRIAQHGTATPSVSGSQLCVRYVPTTGFTGLDSVCVRVCDNTNKCVDVKILITVNAVPHPPSIAPVSIITKQDSTVRVCTTITDPDPNSFFTTRLCNVPTNGTATPSVNGNQLCVTYVPRANYAGLDQICVTVCDNSGKCTNISIPVTVNTRPHSPILTSVPIVTKEDSTVAVCMPITDQDANSTFTTAICGQPTHGTIAANINANQLCVSFTPTAGFSGRDSVCLRLCDNTQLCVNTIVPITVIAKAHAPNVAQANITTKQDSTVTVCTIISDQDANSTFTATLCNNPVGGTATLLVNGNQLCIRFVPTSSYVGQSSICINVCDNTGLCVQSTVPVTINRRPTPPIVPSITLTTKQDSTVTVCTLISDLDPNSTFSTLLCTPSSHGTTTPSVNGNQLCLNYVPNSNYFGKDTVCVRVCDNTGLCTNTIVPIQVNQRQTAPTVSPITITTKQDSTVTVCTLISDLDPNSTFSTLLCTPSLHGTTTPSVNGNQLCLNYVPNSNYFGKDTVCVRVCDNTGLCTNTIVPIQVNQNQTPPNVSISPISTITDTTLTVCYRINDTQGGPFRATLCNDPIGLAATLFINDNELCVQLTTGSTEANSIVCINVCDETGLCTQVQISVKIKQRPSPPFILERLSLITRQDSLATICALVNDLTPNEPYDVSICTQGAHGLATVSIDGRTFCVTYIPTSGFSGTDVLCVRICERTTGLCTDATIPVTVNPKASGRTLVGIRKRLSSNQPSEVRLGSAVNYQITVKNNSNIVLSNLLVHDSIPTGLALNPSNPQGWTPSANGKAAFKTIPSIASGDSVTLDISLILLYGNPRSLVMNRAFVLNASDQSNIGIIQEGEEPIDTATFSIQPFDPMGVIYCENTGSVLKGGHIELVSAPTGGSIFFATDSSNTVLDGTSGIYQFFTNGIPGRYQIRYVHPNAYPISARCLPKASPLDPTGNDGDTTDANADGVIDKDGLVNGYITLGSNVVNNDHLQNFSCNNNPYWLSFDLASGDPFVFNNNLPIACTNIKGKVAVDMNENGILDNNESGLSGVTVQLYKDNNLNTLIDSTKTDANGAYIFDALVQDVYRLKFVKPANHRFTKLNANNNANDNIDSDADPQTGWTHPISLAWGDSETSVAALFVQTNINPPSMTGWHILTKEDSVLNICLPILDNSIYENFTPSVCGAQNGRISNIRVLGAELCFTYTPQLGYRGDDSLCLRICDRDNQCDTARFTFDIRAKNNRTGCSGDTVAPVITLTNRLLTGVRNGDTVSFSCLNPPIFNVNDARAVDNSDSNPSRLLRDAGIKRGSCVRDGYKILMACEWVATDSCGNTSILKIFVKITDNMPPVLGATPANITVNRATGGTIPTAPSVSATDNCGEATVLFKQDSISTGQNCDYVLVRTWTATDECDNTSMAVQRITVNNAINCCTDFIPQKSMIVAVNGCTNLADVCIGMSNVNIVSATDNATPYTSGLVTCTNGLSVRVDTGTHNLIFRTTSGCFDTIEVKVLCANPTPLSIDNTLVFGQKDSIQLQTNELLGSNFTLRKISGTLLGVVDYQILTGTSVVTRTAKSAGVEYATYVMTDEYGISDTTYLKTEVMSRSAASRPIATDDKVELLKGKNTFIDVLQNDSLRGVLKSLTIATKAKQGITILTADNRISFTPINSFCGKDEMTYIICNSNGCDTASVVINILCDDIKVFNAFSPNGDGVNDYFTIEGIEAYPNNDVQIYNRLGNQVMNSKGYKNEWRGTWIGKNLPDDTYFYLINDGNGKIYKGFVQLQR